MRAQADAGRGEGKEHKRHGAQRTPPAEKIEAARDGAAAYWVTGKFAANHLRSRLGCAKRERKVILVTAGRVAAAAVGFDGKEARLAAGGIGSAGAADRPCGRVFREAVHRQRESDLSTGRGHEQGKQRLERRPKRPEEPRHLGAGKTEQLARNRVAIFINLMIV